MPLLFDVHRKLYIASERVKCVDIHSNEPWILATLFNGYAHIYNYETQQLIKSFEICDVPIRVGKFIIRKNWIVVGSDDMHVRIFNYNTLECVHKFEAHFDYIRSIVVHPTLSYLLTSSDDMTVKLWDWNDKWALKQIFEEHLHFIMQIAINPKDNNTFASASLDHTIKIWQLGSSRANFTLEGHEKGVNCLEYYSGSDKPYLVSGSDDYLIKIWDYQNKTCIKTLNGHTNNVICVSFHPQLPIIISGSEDSTIRLWHLNTYRLESTLNFGFDRCWSISCLKESNNVALAYDQGTMMIKLGREDPVISMDVTTGKILWAKHYEIQQVNLKQIKNNSQNLKDGENLSLNIKELGNCEIYPQTLIHSPNGRFVVVCGDGEYIIYTAITLRNKAFGNATEFVWAQDSSQYAIRDGNLIKTFVNFKERQTFKLNENAECIFGGSLLGIKSYSGLVFYDWDTLNLIHRIETQPKAIYWNQNGKFVCISTEHSYYILRFNCHLQIDPFNILSENNENVQKGLWIGDCFVYTSSSNRINYHIAGEIVTIVHLNKTMYLLGYITNENRLYLSDKEMNIVSYELLSSVIEYQTAIIRKDFQIANELLSTIPKDQRSCVAHFLEKQGYVQQAFIVTLDNEHKFDLALKLKELKVCYQLALEFDDKQKWLRLLDEATKQGDFVLVKECSIRAQAFSSLLLLASASSDKQLMSIVGEQSRFYGQVNIAFLSNFLLGNLDQCVEILIENQRLSDAAIFTRTYLPSEINRVLNLWKDQLKQMNMEPFAQSLANPNDYQNLFPDFVDACTTEQYLKQEKEKTYLARHFQNLIPNWQRNPTNEMKKAHETSTDSNKLFGVGSTSSTTTAATNRNGSISLDDLEKELEKFNIDFNSDDEYKIDDAELDEFLKEI